jgi:hypothetical protein
MPNFKGLRPNVKGVGFEATSSISPFDEFINIRNDLQFVSHNAAFLLKSAVSVEGQPMREEQRNQGTNSPGPPNMEP